jgi:hypothetical protein
MLSIFGPVNFKRGVIRLFLSGKNLIRYLVRGLSEAHRKAL